MASPDTVQRAIDEAKRFIGRAELHLFLRRPHWSVPGAMADDLKASSAMKRSSMDLSRALADLRQNRWPRAARR